MKPHLLPICTYWIFFFVISKTQRPKPKAQFPKTKAQNPKTKDQFPKTKDQRPIPKDQFPKTKSPSSSIKINSHPFLLRLFCPYKNHSNCRSYNTHNQSANCTLYRIVLVIEISLRLRCCFVIA